MRKELRWEGEVGRDSFLLRNPGWLLEEHREDFDLGLSLLSVSADGSPEKTNPGWASVCLRKERRALRAGATVGARNQSARGWGGVCVAGEVRWVGGEMERRLKAGLEGPLRPWR